MTTLHFLHLLGMATLGCIMSETEPCLTVQDRFTDIPRNTRAAIVVAFCALWPLVLILVLVHRSKA